ncbi:MAG: twin-arginine translocase subunit TatC [Myxococcota bacterium]
MSRELIPEPEQKQLTDIEEARMSIIEHLGELRTRLLYSLIAIGVGAIVGWIWGEQVLAFLKLPLIESGMELEATDIHHKGLAEPFYVMLKISLLAGVFMASPYVLYQAWKFVAPGLYADEKKIALPFVFVGTIFFFTGAAFCYYGVLPFGYRFLLEFGMQVSKPELMLEEYISLTTKLMFVFGAVFELPVFAMFLSALGVIDHNTLLKYWRGAVVGSFVLGAFLTPADPMTMMLLAVPLVILYFLSVGVAWLFARRRDKDDDRETEA